MGARSGRKWRLLITIAAGSVWLAPEMAGASAPTTTSTVAAGGGVSGAAAGSPGTVPGSPAVPSVPPSITNGQDPRTLLANAIALDSIGQTTSPLVGALAASQQALNHDAVIANQADAQAGLAAARAETAAQAVAAAEAKYQSLAGVLRQSVIQLYIGGRVPIPTVSSGEQLALAADYEKTTLSPDGILALRRADVAAAKAASAAVRRDQAEAGQADARAQAAKAAAWAAEQQLQAQLTAVSTTTAAAVAADHVALAQQAGKELVGATSLEWTPSTPVPAMPATVSVALTWAFSELGKPYLWGGTGPDAFDCSGLTQYVWRAAGVQIPRVAADQDAWAVPVPLSQLLPGDLVFYGKTDIHHVGIYIGDGLMVNAPHTGDVVRVSSIWWSDLAGFGRVHAPSTPVPTHMTPSAATPAPPAVVPAAGAVPSQPTPPPGWTPVPGGSAPMPGYYPKPGSDATGSTTTSRVPAGSSTSSSVVSTTTTSVPDGSTATTTTVPDGSTTTSTSSSTSTTSSPPDGSTTSTSALVILPGQ